jgi:hypothetical protein
LRVDLSIAKFEIGAVDGLDGRVSEIGVNSLTNCICSRSNFKRYVFFFILAPHLDRGLGTAPPIVMVSCNVRCRTSLACPCGVPDGLDDW